MTYCIHLPGKIVFGAGCIGALKDILPKGGKVLLVYGRHFDPVKVREILNGFTVIEHCGIGSEAPLGDVDKLIAKGRENAVTTVLGIGGGSVIDVAKAAAALIELEGSCADYFYGRRKITGKGCFFAALPTTSGTGAEITVNSVLLDTETKVKKSLRHESMVPDAAIVDPELTLSCPFELTAASGMDALTQAIESYISLGANNTSRALAFKAVSLLAANLQGACFAPDNIEYRGNMAEGSMITGMAFAQSSLGAVHGIGHPVGSVCGIAHGLCCAVLLPYLLEFNSVVCRELLDELSGTFKVSGAAAMIGKIRELNRELNIPADFRAYGLARKHYDFILANCRSGSMKSNPRAMSDDQVIELLERVSL